MKMQNLTRYTVVPALAIAALICTAAAPETSTSAPAPATTPARSPELRATPGAAAESKQAGGETAGVVQIANLVYAGTKSSKCFSDHFLVQAERDSSISTSRRFHAVKLASDELFDFPMVIMTGEGAFELPEHERQNLKRFVEGGGFLLASASCSSPEWERSFRAEMARLFPEAKLNSIDMDHPIFHTVYDITTLNAKHGKVRPLEGINVGGRLGVLFSADGLNDTAHTEGCCCCGGNEITNSGLINVNILAYALLY